MSMTYGIPGLGVAVSMGLNWQSLVGKQWFKSWWSLHVESHRRGEALL